MGQNIPPSDTVFLTVRGKLAVSPTENARVLHNETAGSAPGMAAARALGDLSHKVFVPCAAARKMSGADADELLFVDVWEDAKGIMEFFSNKHVQEQGSKLFTSRDPVVWMPAHGSFSFHLPAALGQNNRYLGVIRGKLKNPEAGIKTFRDEQKKNLRDARRRGQMSHEIAIRIPAPDDKGPLELLGLDVWTSFEGMMEHYQATMSGLDGVFAGEPAASIWEQPKAQWNEW